MGIFEKINEWGNKSVAREQERKERAARRWNPSGYTGYKQAMHGGAVEIALMNLINTDDLDQVMEECAPEHSNRMKRIEFQTSTILDKMGDEKKYNELAGKYDELHKKYDELQKNYQELVKMLAMDKMVR